mgnify:FL=1
MPYIYRQAWRKMVAGKFQNAGYSFHHTEAMAKRFERDLNANQAKTNPLERLYAKGVLQQREVDQAFFNYVEAKAEHSLEYGVFLKEDPSKLAAERTNGKTLAQMFQSGK